MSITFHRPENAIKRANEFLELGKYEDAIQCLTDILLNRKIRISKIVHEVIITKLLEICVDNRTSATAKYGLYLYRFICQGTNIKSWEDALKRLLFLAEEKVRMLAIKDLPTSVSTCCTIKLSNQKDLISSEPAEKRELKEKQNNFNCWIQFTLECYQVCLELLRAGQTDKLYHEIARNAFKFCVKHSLKNYLQKLGNILRMHFGYLIKRQTQLTGDALELYLETGMNELEGSLQTELWQEAFRTTQDIHKVISMLPKPWNHELISGFYEKLSVLFWNTDNLLYHAAALCQLFELSRERKISLDVSRVSACMVLASLSVPFPFYNPAAELIIERDANIIEKKHTVLSALLNLSTKPSRSSLLKKLEQYDIVSSTPPEIQKMYELLKNEIDLFNLGAKLKAFILELGKNKKACYFNQYFPSIYKIAGLKILTNISKIYKTVTIERLNKLIPFYNSFDLETFVVVSARMYCIPLKVNHAEKCVYLGSDFNFYLYNTATLDQNYKARESGCYINYFQLLLHTLRDLATKIKPEMFRETKIALKETFKNKYQAVRNEERRNMLGRKKLIDKFKVMLKNTKLKKEEHVRKLAAEQHLKYEAAERKRLLKEAEERAEQRRILREKEIKRQIFLEKVESLRKTEFGQVLEKLDISKLESLDPEILWEKHIQHINKEKKEFQSRLQRQERALYHLERAKKQVETPLLKIQYEKENTIAKELWEEDEKLKIKFACDERSRIVNFRDRFLTMKEDLIQFLEIVKENKKEEFAEKCMEFQHLLDSERRKRLEDRAIERKNLRRKVWMKEQEKKLDLQKHATLSKNITTSPKGGEIFHRHEVSPIVRTVSTQRTVGFDENSSKQRKLKKADYNKDQPVESVIRSPTALAPFYKNRALSPNKRTPFYTKRNTDMPCPILKREISPSIDNQSDPAFRTFKRNQVSRRASQSRENTLFYSSNLPKSSNAVSGKSRTVQYYSERRVYKNLSIRTAAGKLNSEDPHEVSWSTKQSPRDDIKYLSTISLSNDDVKLSNDDEGSQKSSTQRSCTPWAKLTRKEDKK